MPSETAITRVAGRGVCVAGADIDTDRIIPARYMKGITFDGLGEHAFHDVRFDASGRPLDHPLNDARHRGATVLVVGRNFGCGSSREHAPQALARFGFRAIIGESFAEIFAGNCAAIGLPAVRVSSEEIGRLARLVEEAPDAEIVVDLRAKTVTAAGRGAVLEMPESARRALVDGTWDTTALLLAHRTAVDATAARIPYVDGFGAARGA
jgi:3-isopropylmalate/(R)-2-methylmalate dehydratase small subunit